MKNVACLAALVLAFGIGCAGMFGQGSGGPVVPSSPTPMRSLPTGHTCLGNANGVGQWGSQYCESLKCEKEKCVAQCTGPQNQDLHGGCQVSL